MAKLRQKGKSGNSYNNPFKQLSGSERWGEVEKNDARDVKLADGARFKECEKKSHMKSKFKVTRIR